MAMHPLSILFMGCGFCGLESLCLLVEYAAYALRLDTRIDVQFVANEVHEPNLVHHSISLSNK